MIRPFAVPMVVLLLCAGVEVPGQERLAFEVATIKPSFRPTPEQVIGGEARVGVSVTGDLFEANFPLAPIIARAFEVELPQVDMGDFGGGDFFEIRAKLPEGATEAQLPEMLQELLAQRFKLAYHRETREYRSTVLTVGEEGMKLERLPDDTQPSSKSDRLAGDITRTTTISTVPALFPVMNSFGGFPQMVDATGLEGMYTWVSYRQPPAQGMSFQDVVRDSYEVMLDEAGLKLEQRMVPKETIVIDHLEPMPTEN